LFQFAGVDILQSILDIWFQMLICSAIVCCVYDSFGTRLHATKYIDTPLKFVETTHPSAVSKISWLLQQEATRVISTKRILFISRHQYQAVLC